MKTDLSRILAVSGQHGLFRYIAQARNGVIAESLETGKRTVFDAHSRITTLADIAIYTNEAELKLSEVFTAIQKALDGNAVPSSKAPESELVDLFTKAVPNYDADRFHISHMRKVAGWYSELEKYASLDFETEDEQQSTEA